MPAAAAEARYRDVAEFLTFLAKERNDSPHTVKAYGRDLALFAAFGDEYYGGGAWTWAGVDRLAMRSFMGSLQRRGLAKRSVARAVSGVRTFYRFLSSRRGLEVNPARGVRTPKLEKRLPVFLDRSQLEELFRFAEVLAQSGEFQAVRDLALIETLYATGMRLSELAGLNLADVDLVSDQAKVRGKGKKERLLPLGSYAVRALRRPSSRPSLGPGGATGPADHPGHRAALFCGHWRGKRSQDPQLAPQLRHPPAGRRGRPACRAGTPGPLIVEHDTGVYSY